MGISSRATGTSLSHHGLARRRAPRRRVAPRRPVHWPQALDDQAQPPAHDHVHHQADVAGLPPLGSLRSLGASRSLGSASPSVLDWPLAQLHWRDPLRWLRSGWRDWCRAPATGLFFGACYAAMGWALVWTFASAISYALALCAGFLLLGPLLCLGMYETSRRLEAGQPPSWWGAVTAWRAVGAQMAWFSGALLIIDMLWARSAMVVFAVCLDGVPNFKAPLGALLTPEFLTFAAVYVGVGALFAGLIFAVCVISMPLILDRSVDAISAALLSIRLVLTQPAVMCVWAALIVALSVVAMLPGFLGLLVVAPVLGHASWHAYRQVLGQIQVPLD